MKAMIQTKDGVLLKMEISPKSDRFRIVGYNDWREALEVRIKALPQKGKANKEIINEFSEITERTIEIVSGHKSHHKILKIYDISKEELIEILNRYVEVIL
jgi:uncharacterized protein (TIGR00251 family)